MHVYVHGVTTLHDSTLRVCVVTGQNLVPKTKHKGRKVVPIDYIVIYAGLYVVDLGLRC